MHGQSDKMDAEEMESMLKNLLDSGRRGKVTEGRLQSLSMIEPIQDQAANTFAGVSGIFG